MKRFVDLGKGEREFELAHYGCLSYIGGSTKSEEWKQKRKEILKRDNYICQLCFSKAKMLNVHHINNNDHDNKDENLIVLCLKHHEMIHRLMNIMEDNGIDDCYGKTVLRNKILSSLSDRVLTEEVIKLCFDTLTGRKIEDEPLLFEIETKPKNLNSFAGGG